MPIATKDARTPETLEHLSALNKRFIHNYVTNDVPSHDAILHPEFLCITSKGSYQDRAAYLKFWATGFDPKAMAYWDMRDERITVIGDVALVRATNKFVVRRDGKEMTGMTTYTDTYLFERSAWKCIQAQITPLAPESYPADDTIVVSYVEGRRQG